jgi:xanthine/uracil permease
VATTTYFPAEQWIGLLTAAFVIGVSVLGRGFISRIAIFLGLVFGFAASWVADRINDVPVCTKTVVSACTATGHRLDWSSVQSASWFGLPKTITSPTFGQLTGPHLPAFRFTFILLIIPSVIALLAENAGHVKAVSEMTGDDLDPYLGRAFIGDGVGTAVASLVGGSPTTTYAENIGVMAATRVYSTAAYYVAAIVAILFGLCPKFGALIAATPGGVLGGITVILYGMIGLLGAKIWIDNRVNLGNPVNLLPLAAGIITGIGNVTLKITSSFSLTGIALGTIVTIAAYHMLRLVAPAHMRDEPQGTGRVYERAAEGVGMVVGDVETPQGEVSPFRDEFEKPAGPGRHSGHPPRRRNPPPG